MPKKRKIRIRRKITKTTKEMPVSPFESVPKKPEEGTPRTKTGPLEEPVEMDME